MGRGGGGSWRQVCSGAAGAEGAQMGRGGGGSWGQVCSGAAPNPMLQHCYLIEYNDVIHTVYFRLVVSEE